MHEVEHRSASASHTCTITLVSTTRCTASRALTSPGQSRRIIMMRNFASAKYIPASHSPTTYLSHCHYHRYYRYRHHQVPLTSFTAPPSCAIISWGSSCMMESIASKQVQREIEQVVMHEEPSRPRPPEEPCKYSYRSSVAV